jgi:carboxypeptidase Taq
MNDVIETWSAFSQRMQEIKDLDGVLGLLSWDEETYAPAGARASRGAQTATVEAIRHQRLTDPKLGGLIEQLAVTQGLGVERDAMVKRLRRRRDLATKVPESLVKAFAEQRSLSLDAWQRAKKSGDYATFEPHLDKILELLRMRADAIGYAGGERYDALLDEYEPGMRVASLRPVLEALRSGLVPIVESILGKRSAARFSFLENQTYEEEAQWKLSLRLLKDLGFDFEHGRQDRSTHPFTGACAETDVRLTTRIFEDNPLSSFFSTVHECGHGLYEQGFPRAFYRTAIAEAPSMGIHESQSRLWENQVGRSRAFWRHYLPVLRAQFPSQLGGVGVEDMYRAVNVVQATPIRVESDEVTYNLHILVRFELELALLSDDLRAKDLPAAWSDKMERYLGIRPVNDAEGCLQDIHWGWGAIGYFPTYSLGNLYAAQLMAAYEKEHALVWQEIERGQFGHLLEWLRDRIHSKAHLHSAQETVRAAVGRDLEVQTFLDYLKKKYGELYGI